MRLAPPRCCANATTPSARIAAASAAPARGRAARAATVPTALPVALGMTPRLEPSDVDRPPPPVFPPPQVLPVFRSQCAEDRLQGHPPAVALHLRARQDRALPHHGGLRRQAA